MGRPPACCLCQGAAWGLARMGACCSTPVCCWLRGQSRAGGSVTFVTNPAPLGPRDVGLRRMLPTVFRACYLGACVPDVWGCAVPWGCPGSAGLSSPPSLLAGHNGLVAVSTGGRALTLGTCGAGEGLQQEQGLGAPGWVWEVGTTLVRGRGGGRDEEDVPHAARCHAPRRLPTCSGQGCARPCWRSATCWAARPSPRRSCQVPPRALRLPGPCLPPFTPQHPASSRL